MFRAALLFPVLAIAPVAQAQVEKLTQGPETVHIAPAPSARFPAAWYPGPGDGNDIVLAPITGKPFTATVEQTLPQDTHRESQVQVTHYTLARDRDGRVYSDPQTGGITLNGRKYPLSSITVDDPVSHCKFRWSKPVAADITLPPEQRLAVVTCLPQTLRYKVFDPFALLTESLPEGATQHGNTTSTVEHLPPLKLDGVTVLRLRVTNSTLDEHGQPKQWSTETWYSHDIEEIIRIGDKEQGTTTLTGIHLTDPDPALFYPPGDYTIEPKPNPPRTMRQ